MRRTTVYLESETDVLLKLEAMRRKQPVAEIIREALQGYVHRTSPGSPPGLGAFDSGHEDTAERAEELLGPLGFGRKRPRGQASAKRSRRTSRKSS